MSIYGQLARAIRPPADLVTLQNVRRAITDDGRPRLDRATGKLPRPSLVAVSAVSVQAEPTLASNQSNVQEQLIDQAQLAEVYAPIAVSTPSVTLLADPTPVGTELSANVNYAGAGAAPTAARSDHDHAGVYSPEPHDHAGLYATIDHDHAGVYAPAPLVVSAALDFPAIAAQSAAELPVVVPGAAEGWGVVLGAPAAIEAGLTWCGYVSAADTVTVRLANPTAAAIDPAAANWTVIVWPT